MILEKEQDFITESFNNEGRLYAYLIPKKYLKKMSGELIKKALEILSKYCLDEIKKLKGEVIIKAVGYLDYGYNNLQMLRYT